MSNGVIASLLAEPRGTEPPVRVPRDWALLAVLVPLSIGEGIFREELVWRVPTTIVGTALIFTLLWRRTHPLAMVALSFGASGLMNLMALAAGVRWEGLSTGASMLILPYALLRWGSGREAVAGLTLMMASLSLGLAVSFNNWGDVVGATIVLLFPAALGASVRYQANARIREREEAKHLEREQLARELHDTVAHHVSAIAIQAQAGRTVAATRPEAAVEALSVIEEAASRTLEEMRSMVGALRGDDEAELAPQPGVVDIERLARTTESGPRIAVELAGDLDGLRPAVDAALYRLAQESITNAIRHAKGASRIEVRVEGDGNSLHLTVRDDGAGGASGGGTGYGLVGMAERARLLGGSLEAGPNGDRGWTVRALLPRHGTAS